MAKLNPVALRITAAAIGTNTVSVPSKPWIPMRLKAAGISLKGSVKTEFLGSVLRHPKALSYAGIEMFC
jgi:hypothetical protein